MVWCFQLGKLGAAVSQILAILGEAADGVVAYSLIWQPHLTHAVTQGQGLKESGSGVAPNVYDFTVPSSNPDCAHFQQVPDHFTYVSTSSSASALINSLASSMPPRTESSSRNA